VDILDKLKLCSKLKSAYNKESCIIFNSILKGKNVEKVSHLIWLATTSIWL